MREKNKKSAYSIQIVIILAIFFFVLFNLIFKLVIDMRSQALEKKDIELEKQRVKQEFLTNIDERYDQLKKLYDAKEFDKAVKIIKVFNQYDKAAFKDLAEMKKAIRLHYLKKKMEFIPKINLDEYMQLSKDIDIEEDDSTEVFIRTPRYGQFFYTSDLPIVFEGVALSVTGDFSGQIVWSSDLDGTLGEGQKLIVSLSVGKHLITAKSSNGVTVGEMSIRIFIEKDPEFLKQYSRE